MFIVLAEPLGLVHEDCKHNETFSFLHADIFWPKSDFQRSQVLTCRNLGCLVNCAHTADLWGTAALVTAFPAGRKFSRTAKKKPIKNVNVSGQINLWSYTYLLYISHKKATNEPYFIVSRFLKTYSIFRTFLSTLAH